MFTCVSCGQVKPDEELVFEPPADPWCGECFEAEGMRSAREDAAGRITHFGGLPLSGEATSRSRPPKYMVPQSEWAQYGY